MGELASRVARALLAVGIGACGGAVGPAQLEAPRAPSASEAWTYELVASPNADELALQAAFPSGTGTELTVEEGAERFVRAVEVSGVARGWTPVTPRGSSWFVSSCARGCRVRYRFELRAAGRANERVSIAREDGAAVESPPSSWLLRPARAPLGTRFRLHVAQQRSSGDSLVLGLFPASGARDTYEGQTGDAFQLPYAAFGRLRVYELHGGAVTLALLPGSLGHEADVVAWATEAASAVAAFYGSMPAPRVLVVARPVPGRAVGFGTTMGNAGAAIAVDIGQDVSRDALDDDWVLVHEMVHTALPDLDRSHHWLEEGLATYVEPLARVRAGHVAPERIWRDWVRGMPNGLPEPGDRGLDRTPTWGRTYWGGALFCLLADVEIRTRTNGRRSLDDALRAIVASGGNIAVSWPLDRVLDVGDRATGESVLRELYDRMGNAAVPVDLPALWKRLGVVVRDDDSVSLDDAAPLAAVRRAMTSRSGR